MQISNNWFNIKSRKQLWKTIYKREKDYLQNETIENKTAEIIRERFVKVYEIIVIFSSLSFGALVSMAETSNNNHDVVIVYDIIRGYGIVSSGFGAIVSLTTCMMVSALPIKYTMDFIMTLVSFSNIPVITTIFSTFALMLCASLQFKNETMYIVLPYSSVCFLYSLRIYNVLRKSMIKLIEE
jgi:hypothetical protein